LLGAKLNEKIYMLIVHVHVHVKPECVEAFKAATLGNARQSVREPGIARFDFMVTPLMTAPFTNVVRFWGLKTDLS